MTAISPMSKVQSSKSATRETQLARESLQDKAADFRLSTLDFGQTHDFELSVSDLRKSFLSPAGERIEVLRGASFSARAGESLAIMGTSGAGKSTLLHLLGGLEATDHGTIMAGKFAVHRAGPPELARFRNERVGFVFQFHYLLPDLTAAENVSLPLRITRVSYGEAMSKATQLLAEVGLDKRVAASLVGNLSGGEQQRVAVCRALITSPSLVLADEPTGNLDTITGDEIARAIVKYARNRRALVIFATHNIAVAEACDRTLVLSNGRLR